ncbi:conserved hypothetical protein [Cupriavidus taiwanensis]|nr:conserved hypothetical protein [Cupriavidus taiwanensis]
MPAQAQARDGSGASGQMHAERRATCAATGPKNKTPEDRDLPGFRRQGRLSLAETEGFEPSIQVLARMLP